MSMIGLEEQCFGGLLVQGGYDSIYRGLLGRLAECDFRESAQRLGLEYVEGQVLVRFLMRDYGITLNGVQPLDGQPVNVNNLSVVLYYLLSKGDGEPENSYIPFQSIPRLTGGLNAQTRLMMQELLREAWLNTGTTLLFVTHDVEEALFLADRILIMSTNPGKIVEEIALPFGRERDIENLSEHPDYSGIKHHVLHRVRKEAKRHLG